MFDPKVWIILAVIVLLACVLIKSNNRENFVNFYNEVRSEGYPPLYNKFDSCGRHIMPARYLDYAPYWQPPDRERQMVGTEKPSDYDDEVIDRRWFW